MKQRRTARWCVLAATLATVGASAAVRPDDYVRGVSIAASERPIVQVELPEIVYRTIVTDDLSDVRVFNADGVPIAHALCAAPAAQSPRVIQTPLPVYRLQEVPSREGDTQVEVRTPGAQVSVRGDTLERERHNGAFVIDAREVTDELRALQFAWASPDDASEVRVNIQASEDLDRWRTLVAATTLVQVRAGERQLGRDRVAIPQARYTYLRLERVDRGPPLQLDGVFAEQVMPAVAIEPVWLTVQPTTSGETNTIAFDTLHRAPIGFARVRPVQANTSLQVALDSRADSNSRWTTRWTGEAYWIATEREQRVSPPAEFKPTTDAHWRLRLTQANEAFHQPPSLELGYRPARLRFLAQGAGPYTLAFGSRRAEPAPARPCNSLLGNLSPEEREQNVGEGSVGAERTLGGAHALRPLPKKTPLRQIMLWGVLIAGVAVLIALAVSLLKRIRPEGDG